ncbi:Sodium-dependent phosphate transporter, partial [Gryllus bimaculatus]
VSTPWLKILTSGPMWLTVAVSWACLWGMFTLLTQAPTYFQVVHGWGIRTNGLLSGIPHICRTALGIGLSYVCDVMLERGVWSRTTVRKISSCVCSLVQGIFLIGLAFSGCNSILAIICLTVALATTGAESPGPLAAYVDLSPNHAGIVFGISNMVTVAPGFLSPFIVGYLTFENQTAGQWQIVFLIAAAMTVIPGLVHLFIGTADTQSWNYSEDDKNEEMDHLKQESLENKR